jgi:GT2 family glycosyltransferase
MYAKDNAMCFPTVMMRRDAAVKAGGFREPFKIAEDYDLCLRLLELGRVENLPEPLVDYRQHLASTVNSRRWEADTYAALANTLARERRETGTDRLQRGEPVSLNFGPGLAARENAFDTQLRWAWWALTAGHVKTARKYAARTLRIAPFRKESWRIAYCAVRGH